MENNSKWVACWGNATSITDRREAVYAKDLTLRYPIRMCFNGSMLRFRFSNLTGTEPVTIDKAFVGHTPITFGGQVGVTAASSTAITADELISLVYSLKAPYRRNAKFLLNDATISIIRKLKDNNGAYLWQPSVQAGQPDRLLGYEIYTSPYVPTAAAGALAIAFGDFKNYWIGDRAGRTVQRLNELYATNGQIGYVSTERVDGKVILPEGIKLFKMKP